MGVCKVKKKVLNFGVPQIIRDSFRVGVGAFQIKLGWGAFQITIQKSNSNYPVQFYK